MTKVGRGTISSNRSENDVPCLNLDYFIVAVETNELPFQQCFANNLSQYSSIISSQFDDTRMRFNISLPG